MSGPNPSGLCMCGCGERTPLATCDDKPLVLGEPVRFLPGHHVRKSAEEVFWSKVKLVGECWEWQGNRATNGYGQMWANGCTVRAHRFSYELHHGPIPPGLWVLHHCDNPLCVNPAHLYAGTAADNAQDKLRRGRHRVGHNVGEKNGMACLTHTDVEEIRKLTSDGMPQVDIARRFGVTKSAVSKIVRGKRWLA